MKKLNTILLSFLPQYFILFPMLLCPCFSKKEYSKCCKKLHLGASAANAEELMRSRYSAYSMGLIQYIITSTHSNSPLCKKDPFIWSDEIIDFSKNTTFKGLTILEHTVHNDFETVTFTAHLSRDKKNISYTEKSLFRKENGILKYITGSHL